MSLLRAIVTLDTGERPEYINIYEGDDIELLASFFCERHEIMEDGKQFIINEIENQLSTQEKLKEQTQQVKTKALKQCQSQAIFLHQQKICNKLNSNLEKNDYQALHKNVWTTIEKKPSTTQLHQRNNSNASLITKKQTKVKDNKKNTKLQRCLTNIDEAQEIQQQPRRTLQEQMNYASKLMNMKSASEKRLQKLRLESKSPKNQDFKPQINKNNIYKKCSEKIDREDYELANMIGLSINKNMSVLSQPRNRKKQDQEILKKIFNELDSDKDGLISTQFINFHINHIILEKILPVLEYMEEQHLILDFNAFSNLLRSLNILIY